MGQELATGYVSIVATTRGLGRDISREFSRAGAGAGKDFTGSMEGSARSGMKGLGSALGGMLKVGLIGAAAGAGLAIGGALKDGIKGASDLEQSVGGVQAVFKNFAGQIDQASKTAATNLGLTRNSYNELATTLGAGLKNKGFQDYAGQTQKLIGLGADLAAQFGGSTQEAVEAISSLMRGETDPIEKYGVAINETAINAELAARGQDKLKGAALEQAKAQARVDLLMRQTRDAQGAFARESDTFAGKQQRAAAQWEDLKTKIGGAFLPVLSSAMGFISSKAIPGMESLGGRLSGLSDNFGIVQDNWEYFKSALANGGESDGAPWLNSLASTLLSVRDAAQQIVPAAVSLGQTIAAQWVPIFQQIGSLFTTVVVPALKSLWDSIMANVVPAFVNLIGKVQEAYNVVGPIIQQIVGTIVTKFQELSPQINAAMTQVGAIIGGAMNLISAVIGVVLGAIRWAWDQWGSNIMTGIRFVMDAVMGIIGGALNIIQGVIRTVTSLITGDWAGAWEGIKQILFGAWEVIKSVVDLAINSVRNTIDGVLNAILGVFGISRVNVLGTWNQMWEGLKAAGSMALDWIKGGISAGLDAIQGFFRAAVAGIRTIWDGLRGAASAPVRFVIDTVINNGIIKGWNALVDLLKLGNLRVAPISVPGFWSGGVLPGSGTGRGDDMVVIDRHGRPQATVASGEPVISRASYAANKPIVDAILAGAKIPGFFLGGFMPTPGPVRPHRLPYYGASWAGDMGYGMGSPIYAWKDGTVASTSFKNVSYGNETNINHAGQSTKYAHQSAILVRPGDVVRAGQLIGKIGSTGNSTGPHLHFEVRGGNVNQADGASGSPGGFDPLAAMAGWVTDKLATPVRALLDRIPAGGVFAEAAKGFGTRMLDAAIEKVKSYLPSFGADPSASPVANADGSRVSWGGHTFDRTTADMLAKAQEIAGTRLVVTQGSFRPATSYSGTTHTGGGAVDIGSPVTAGVVAALRKAGFAAWDRTGKGNWGPHIHAIANVPSASASAKAQYADYLRGGDGLGHLRGTRWSGGGMRPLSEDGRPELVVGPSMHRLRAGTRVFNANETQQIMGGRNITIAPVIREGESLDRQMEEVLFRLADEALGVLS